MQDDMRYIFLVAHLCPDSKAFDLLKHFLTAFISTAVKMCSLSLCCLPNTEMWMATCNPYFD